MEGLTIAEMADLLGLPVKTITARIRRAGIVPKYRAGRVGLYEKEVVKQISHVPRPGRPPKDKDASK